MAGKTGTASKNFWVAKVNETGEINSDCSIIKTATLTANSSDLSEVSISFDVFNNNFDTITTTNATPIATNSTTQILCDGFTNLPGEIINSLRVSKSGSNIVLNWSAPGSSCTPTAYGVYRGFLPLSKYDYTSLSCDVSALTFTDTNATASYYYVIVPNTNSYEGSYGKDSNNQERPQGLNACNPQNTQSCN